MSLILYLSPGILSWGRVRLALVGADWTRSRSHPRCWLTWVPPWMLPSLTVSPSSLPLAVFCDYYNPPDECEWHYEPCGNRTFETCRTINGIHSNISVSYLEGEPAGPFREGVAKG